VGKDTTAALKASGAVRFVGTIAGATATTPQRLDVTYENGGTIGTITVSGITLDLVAVGGVTYSKAPAAFYVAEQITPANAAKVANRWLKLPADSAISGFDLQSFATSFGKNPAGDTIDNKVTTSTLNGQPVVVVHQTNGSDVYVAAKGKPYPLKVTAPTSGAGKGLGAATLSDFGKQKTLKAPADAIDVTKAIPS
jgi:hypothetical protein